MYQVVTERGNKPLTGVIYDLECARLAYAIYNGNRAAVQRANTAKQVAWRRNYNAARDERERAAWLAHQPSKQRVPSKAILVGVEQ